ncbi:hypothetical protein M9Y10_025604 [Tritrichomonas musculus]|uniref:Protein kinase domain-containing protein n=1 Tax=Tritrichomonas musculus TaxID=1915356 RepID=A0ABR2H9A8_9EUKA
MEINQVGHTSSKKGNLPFSIHDYYFTTLIGQGGSSLVYLGQNLKFGNQFVAKVMSVEPSEMSECWKIFDAEVSTLSVLDHPHIIRLYDHFREGNKFYMILEYCPGGSLQSQISRSNGLTSAQFRLIGREITEALAYCHEKGIAHRDIKTQNILLDMSGHSHLADFGLSLKTQKGQLYLSNGGSFEFTAPEIFTKKPHDPLAGDAWALGVVFAIMASGSSPWKYESLGDLKIIASQAQIQYKKPIPDIIDDLIRQLITINPSERLTMKQVLEHPAFKFPVSLKNKIHVKQYSNSISNAFPVLKWNNINRTNHGSSNSSNLSFGSDQDSSSQDNTSTIHSASSAAIHSNQKSRVRQRLLSKNWNSTGPYNGGNDVLEID